MIDQKRSDGKSHVSDHIQTKRCILKKICLDDYDAVKRLYQDKDVRRYLGGAVSLDRFDRSFQSMIASSDCARYWVVRDIDSQMVIGLVSLDGYHDSIETELSYQFLPLTWGKGYAFEVLQAVLHEAFAVWQLDQVVVETQTANIASCALLRKLGMRESESMLRFGEWQTIFVLSRQI